MTGRDADALSDSYAERVRAGKRLAAKELREACMWGWENGSGGYEWIKAEALRRWPDEERSVEEMP